MADPAAEREPLGSVARLRRPNPVALVLALVLPFGSAARAEEGRASEAPEPGEGSSSAEATAAPEPGAPGEREGGSGDGAPAEDAPGEEPDEGNFLFRYLEGIFRDRHFVGAQVEYRFLPLPFFSDPFWRRFGASLFVGTGAVFSGSGPSSVSVFVVAGGAGLRFLLFPDKDVYTRLDVAFTEEAPTFYLLIGEAF